MIQRSLKPSKEHSFFLFGPRGWGKSTLLQELFSVEDTLFIDLLDIQLMDDLLVDPGRFERIIDAPEVRTKRVVQSFILSIRELNVHWIGR